MISEDLSDTGQNFTPKVSAIAINLLTSLFFGLTNVTALPLFPLLPVRPAMCVYPAALEGRVRMNTYSTSGKSSPRANRSPIMYTGTDSHARDSVVTSSKGASHSGDVSSRFLSVRTISIREKAAPAEFVRRQSFQEK
jgi:hypothetical protein